MFQTILHALQLMANYENDDEQNTGVVTNEMVNIIKKCAWSSVSRERRKILEILTQFDTPMTASEIGASNDFGLQKEGVEKYLHALHSSGLVQKEVAGNSHRWYIDSEETKKFVRELSGIEKKELMRSEAELIFDGYEADPI